MITDGRYRVISGNADAEQVVNRFANAHVTKSDAKQLTTGPASHNAQESSPVLPPELLRCVAPGRPSFPHLFDKAMQDGQYYRDLYAIAFFFGENFVKSLQCDETDNRNANVSQANA